MDDMINHVLREAFLDQLDFCIALTDKTDYIMTIADSDLFIHTREKYDKLRDSELKLAASECKELLEKASKDSDRSFREDVESIVMLIAERVSNTNEWLNRVEAKNLDGDNFSILQSRKYKKRDKDLARRIEQSRKRMDRYKIDKSGSLLHQ